MPPDSSHSAVTNLVPKILLGSLHCCTDSLSIRISGWLLFGDFTTKTFRFTISEWENDKHGHWGKKNFACAVQCFSSMWKHCWKKVSGDSQKNQGRNAIPNYFYIFHWKPFSYGTRISRIIIYFSFSPSPPKDLFSDVLSSEHHVRYLLSQNFYISLKNGSWAAAPCLPAVFRDIVSLLDTCLLIPRGNMLILPSRIIELFSRYRRTLTTVPSHSSNTLSGIALFQCSLAWTALGLNSVPPTKAVS